MISPPISSVNIKFHFQIHKIYHLQLHGYVLGPPPLCSSGELFISQITLAVCTGEIQVGNH